MQGVVIHEFGPIESHNLEEFPAPEPGPSDVLIDVHVVGVNFPDTLMVQGLYQTKPDRPFVPGRDAAGVAHSIKIAPSASPAANYAFDVTPARLVSGLITERGRCQASRQGLLKLYPERR